MASDMTDAEIVAWAERIGLIADTNRCAQGCSVRVQIGVSRPESGCGFMPDGCGGPYRVTGRLDWTDPRAVTAARAYRDCLEWERTTYGEDRLCPETRICLEVIDAR